METIKIDLPILQKYFSDVHDFKSDIYFNCPEDSNFWQTDLLLDEYSPQYTKISEICNEYDMKEFTDTFINLIMIGFNVKSLRNSYSLKYGYIYDMNYKTELFTLFENLLPSYNEKDNITRKLDINFITIQGHKGKSTSKIKCDENKKKQPKEPYNFQIKDKTLIEQIQQTIMDRVGDWFYNKSYNMLSDLELNQILNNINHWHEVVKTAQKGGSKTTSYFLKIFALDILNYINNETPMKDKIETLQYEFIGKLFEVYDLKKPTTLTGYAKMISNIISAKR